MPLPFGTVPGPNVTTVPLPPPTQPNALRIQSQSPINGNISEMLNPLDLEALVKLDHNYSLPYEAFELNFNRSKIGSKYKKGTSINSKSVGDKTDDLILSESNSANPPFPSIKLLFYDENEIDIYAEESTDDSSSNSSTPSTTPSKLENLLKSPRSSNKGISQVLKDEESDVEVDVVEQDPPKKLIQHDVEKGRIVMSQWETHVDTFRQNESDVLWQSKINMDEWSEVQLSLFKKVMEAIDDEYFARLTYYENTNEILLRRNSLDLAAARIRKALTSVCWVPSLTQWLHSTLIKVLDNAYFAIYLDIIHALRNRVSPSLIDRMISLNKFGVKGPDDSEEKLDEDEKAVRDILNVDAATLLHKKSWEPVIHSYSHVSKSKLKCNPVFLIVPSGPSWCHTITVKRNRSFINMLSNLGKVITVTMAQEISLCSYLSLDELAEKMIISSKLKLTETKVQLPERPIYLVGWGTGSVIAATVSLTEQVAGVICLGFPLFGLAGTHGEDNDPLLQMKHPILFITGERATNSTICGIDNFRKELLNVTESLAFLVAIKSADENLHIGRHHRKKLLLTQNYVDKCIVDEIGSFINVTTEQRMNAAAQAAQLAARSASFSHQLDMEGLGMSLSLCRSSSGDVIQNVTGSTLLDCDTKLVEDRRNRRKTSHRKSTSADFQTDISSSGAFMTALPNSPSTVVPHETRGRPRGSTNANRKPRASKKALAAAAAAANAASFLLPYSVPTFESFPSGNSPPYYGGEDSSSSGTGNIVQAFSSHIPLGSGEEESLERDSLLQIFPKKPIVNVVQTANLSSALEKIKTSTNETAVAVSCLPSTSSFEDTPKLYEILQGGCSSSSYSTTEPAFSAINQKSDSQASSSSPVTALNSPVVVRTESTVTTKGSQRSPPLLVPSTSRVQVSAQSQTGNRINPILDVSNLPALVPVDTRNLQVRVPRLTFPLSSSISSAASITAVDPSPVSTSSLTPTVVVSQGLTNEIRTLFSIPIVNNEEAKFGLYDVKNVGNSPTTTTSSSAEQVILINPSSGLILAENESENIPSEQVSQRHEENPKIVSEETDKQQESDKLSKKENDQLELEENLRKEEAGKVTTDEIKPEVANTTSDFDSLCEPKKDEGTNKKEEESDSTEIASSEVNETIVASKEVNSPSKSRGRPRKKVDIVECHDDEESGKVGGHMLRSRNRVGPPPPKLKPEYVSDISTDDSSSDDEIKVIGTVKRRRISSSSSTGTGTNVKNSDGDQRKLSDSNDETVDDNETQTPVKQERRVTRRGRPFGSTPILRRRRIASVRRAYDDDGSESEEDSSVKTRSTTRGKSTIPTPEESDDESISRRVTRSRRRSSPSNSRGGDDLQDGDRRKIRSIFPVTPASLSTTRTRKVSIPKFFAYGM